MALIQIQVEAAPLLSLTPAPWNPRTISDERFQNLCRSIEADPDFLWRRPVLATADGTIYAGNMRFRAQHLLETILGDDIPCRTAATRSCAPENPIKGLGHTSRPAKA